MTDDPILGGQEVSKGARRDDESSELNNGGGFLGIDLDDTHCPECGREINRKLFSYKAFCPICDTLTGKIKRFLGLVNDD